MINKDFAFCSAREYFLDLIKNISSAAAGDRVLVATMAFDIDEPLIDELVDAMCEAARRSAHVSLLVDAFIFLVRRRSNANGTVRVSAKRAVDALNKLKQAGGHYAVTNRPGRGMNNPYGSRSHIKTAVINNFVYVGGCNLNTAEHLDMMVRFYSRETADWLYGQMLEAMSANNVRQAFGQQDKQWSVDDKTELIIDAGVRRQSLIYKNALEMIDSAQEWLVITCQFFPNSVTARHLAAAYKRGVKVSIYYNHPSKHRRPHNLLHHMVVFQEKRKHPSVMFKDELRPDLPFLHAKLLASEQGAMIGSHNYVIVGVNFGTAEIALKRMDPEFSRQALAAFISQLDN